MTNKSGTTEEQEEQTQEVAEEALNNELKKGSAMMRFWIWRDEDESGVSGTGRVAEGVEFSDGEVIVHWISSMPSTNHYKNIKQVEAVHGHGGKTRIIFIDDHINGNGNEDTEEENQ